MKPFRFQRADGAAAPEPVRIPEEVLDRVAKIVAAVRAEGEPAVRRWAEELGDLEAGAPLLRERAELEAALHGLDAEPRTVLERTAERLRLFARAQREALGEVEVEIPGGRAGHQVVPVERAGGYVPAGRHPLPSSVLMTGVPAEVAGVEELWLASPRPSREILAAAALVGARGVLAVGGAQGVAALALGAGPVPPCDVVAGPGSLWVTAAKKVLYGEVGIDLLAGPSEIVVLADEHADPDRVAAELTAQAEHDPAAVAVLVTTEETLIERVERRVEERLEGLSDDRVARAALAAGRAVVGRDLDHAAELADAVAPEHLHVMTRDPEAVASRCRHYGAVFLGEASSVVLGDYGAGPNHTLPTGGGARHAAGLSVLSFLRVRTWLRIDDRAAAEELYRDARAFAHLEGLEAHAAVE